MDNSLGFFEKFLQDVVFGDEDDDGLGNFSIGDGVFGDFFEVFFELDFGLEVEGDVLEGHNGYSLDKVFHGLFGLHHKIGCGSRLTQNIEASVKLVDLNNHFIFLESLLVVFLQDGAIELGDFEVNGMEVSFFAEANGEDVAVLAYLLFLFLEFL